ncbi:MAG: hypothetical protein ACLSVP_02845 [Fusobacterium sp.]
MKKNINSWNKKVDNIDNWLNEVFGNKLPQYLEKNMKKIYLLFFFLTLLGIKEAYEQRGYFAVGGEIMIMLIPVILKFYLEMRKDNKRYYELLREMEECEEEEI